MCDSLSKENNEVGVFARRWELGFGLKMSVLAFVRYQRQPQNIYFDGKSVWSGPNFWAVLLRRMEMENGAFG